MNKVFFFSHLPAYKKLSSLSENFQNREFVVIYDETLKCENFCRWLKDFKYKFAVSSGEKLKSVSSFSQLVTKVLQKTSEDRIAFISVGGGSVGDVVGFMASIYQRGVPLVQIPSTWLAAIDSSHGGKTALNLDNKKNQIGSFYLPEATVICEELLRSLEESRIKEASSELLKVALISGGALLEKLKLKEALDFDLFYELVPLAIRAKMDVVNKDFREVNGIRALLNLGHSWGHVLEAQCKLSHGLAVAQGLYFALEWSRQREVLDKESYRVIFDLFKFYLGSETTKSRIDSKQVIALLESDKKKTRKNYLNFVFIKSLGEVSLQEVSLLSFMDELKRQGRVS